MKLVIVSREKDLRSAVPADPFHEIYGEPDGKPAGPSGPEAVDRPDLVMEFRRYKELWDDGIIT